MISLRLKWFDICLFLIFVGLMSVVALTYRCSFIPCTTSWREQLTQMQAIAKNIDSDAVLMEGFVQPSDRGVDNILFDYTFNFVRPSGKIISISYRTDYLPIQYEVEIDQQWISPGPSPIEQIRYRAVAETLILGPDEVYQNILSELRSFSNQQTKPCLLSILLSQAGEAHEQSRQSITWSVMCSSAPHVLFLWVDPETGTIIERKEEQF